MIYLSLKKPSVVLWKLLSSHLNNDINYLKIWNMMTDVRVNELTLVNVQEVVCHLLYVNLSGETVFTGCQLDTRCETQLQ